MDLKNQVTSLELSKKLKELGVKQDSLFYLDVKSGDIHYGFPSGNISKDEIGKRFISAFTVAELGEILPREINIPFKNGKPRDSNNPLRIIRGVGWRVIYVKPKGVAEYFETQDENLSNSMAKMLIYLITNNLITL